MLTMCYQVIIPGGNDQAGYCISNGSIPDLYRDDGNRIEDNGARPSLSVEVEDVHHEDAFDVFFTDLGEPDYYFSDVELSRETLGELKNAFLGKPSSWRLTNVRITRSSINFDCCNFGRKIYLAEEEKRLRDAKASDAEIDDVARMTEPDHVCFVFCDVRRTYTITINEYSKKGKVKRRLIIRYHRFGEENESTENIAEIHEYSKGRLKRVIDLTRTEDKYSMLAEITEFKY